MNTPTTPTTPTTRTSESAYRKPLLRMTTAVYREIMCTIGRFPPETGGLLLGPVGRCVATRFHFDAEAACSGATYTPDHRTLQRLMASVWLPSGLDMKGFVHSHPGRLDSLSSGDIEYIGRLLKRNEDMDQFLAPIVLPGWFRFCPIVVERRDPTAGRVARLELIPAE